MVLPGIPIDGASTEENERSFAASVIDHCKTYAGDDDLAGMVWAVNDTLNTFLHNFRSGRYRRSLNHGAHYAAAVAALVHVRDGLCTRGGA